MSKILSKRCPYCRKVIESLYQKQLEYNYSQHINYCKKKTKQTSKVELIEK
jgi:hypothetical protein